MTDKRYKWAAHLDAAEASRLSLAAYAQAHHIDVHRLYEARQLRKLQGTTAWSIVRVKEQAPADLKPKASQRVAPTTIAMQARLGNAIVLSWHQDQTNTAALDGILRALAALPCSI